MTKGNDLSQTSYFYSPHPLGFIIIIIQHTDFYRLPRPLPLPILRPCCCELTVCDCGIVAL
jgi:hypothetical protein